MLATPHRSWTAISLLAITIGGDLAVADPANNSRPKAVAATATTPAPSALAADTPARQLTEDGELATASGTTFQAAKGWFVSTSGGRVLLQDPDRELDLTLLEVQAADGASAIASAWKLVKPDFARTIRHSMSPPAREGWDEVVQQVYEVPTEEKRTVIGVARRKGETWYVALIDAADAALDRRSAQLNTAILSLKAPGTEKESFAGKKAHALDAERQKQFATFIEESRAAAKVPGVAVAVVQGGKVVFERGFGTRDMSSQDAVSPSTLFMIGSTSKSLTTLMMARLVDEGRTTWDRPVVELFPEFALGDAEVTRKLTLQHTVCACTGLPRQDMEMLFESAGNTAENTITRMRSMKPTTGFGETFQYSNPMVSTGGYVAAHVAYPNLALGEAYDRAMQTYVFDPLGMKKTTFAFDRALAADHAQPHGMDLQTKVSRLPIEIEQALTPVRPAGGAWSNARDLARYVQMELAGGVAPGGKRVLSEKALLYRREPQVKITDQMSYGLGLFVGKDREARIVHHGGNTLGFTTDMFFLPDHDVGAVVLTNLANANGFRNAVRRRLLELLFDGRDEAKESLAYGIGQMDKMLKKELEEVVVAPDRGWLGSLVGAYSNPALGRVDIRMEGDNAVIDTGEWRSALAQKRGPDGVVKLLLTSPPWAGFELIPTPKDGRTTLVLQLAQQEYTFEPAAQ